MMEDGTQVLRPAGEALDWQPSPQPHLYLDFSFNGVILLILPVTFKSSKPKFGKQMQTSVYLAK